MLNNIQLIFTKVMSSARIKAIVVWGGICILFCLIVYLGTNEIASNMERHYGMYFEFEKGIPLVPWMIYIYASFHLLLALNFFIIKDPKVIRAFTMSLMASSFLAALIFLAFPGELGFSRVEGIEGYETMYLFLHEIDHPHNLYPSLHITFSVLTAFAMFDQTRSNLFHGFLFSWVFLICCSVVLVHQHHLFDILTGLLLSYVVIKFVYRRVLIK
ncbi:phosphatase PAP2 family protein [Crocinitomicaceae bacterium]|nr:phosphatase PAP2 family protein [Crocinitomicaceae bacterium]